MRIATYNVEWFNNLFDNDGNLLVADTGNKRIVIYAPDG
mgnify:CR=1 FL=1